MTYEELKAICLKNGVELSDKKLEQLGVYARLLAEWNQKINLTSITEEPSVIEKHFLDSIIPCFHYDFQGKAIVDIGSGGGFPGMVLAILNETSSLTLVDATAKKFKFLEAVRNELGLSNVEFRCSRIEDLKLNEHFDVAICRGFAAMPIFLEVATPLVKVGGKLIVMKGSKGEEELESSKGAIKKLSLKMESSFTDYLPSSSDTRINYCFTKQAPTSGKYPRRWDEILKKPL